MNEEEKPESCYACGFETTELLEVKNHRNPIEPESMWFCDLCASTHSATAYEYPSNFPDRSGDVLHTICYIGNVILQEIKKSNQP